MKIGFRFIDLLRRSVFRSVEQRSIRRADGQPSVIYRHLKKAYQHLLL